MFKKIIIIILLFCLFLNAASGVDSSNWTTADVGYETFKIPPKYENPYRSDFDMYEFDEDIDVFTIRYVNPNIMSLYGYYLKMYPEKKVTVADRDAVHFTYHDRYDNADKSILWFSSGEEFYYITWIGSDITSNIEEIVKSSSPSKYSHDDFYGILNDVYQQYETVESIESQKIDYPSDSGDDSFVSFGSNGINFGVMT